MMSTDTNKKIKKCNLCDSETFAIVFSEDQTEILSCKKCGLVFSGTVRQEPLISSANPKDIEAETKLKIYIYRLALRVLTQQLDKGKLLDVGCRTGTFMIEARKCGFDPTGVDISDKVASYARSRGLNVITGTIQTAGFSDKTFDVVTYFATLEHIHDPSRELREALRVLKDDGVLVLEIPNWNFNHLKARLATTFGKKAGLMPENHVFHYSAASIAKMLTKNQFQPKFVKAICSAEGAPNTFLGNAYAHYLAPLFEGVPLKWILCNDLIVFAAKDGGP